MLRQPNTSVSAAFEGPAAGRRNSIVPQPGHSGNGADWRLSFFLPSLLSTIAGVVGTVTTARVVRVVRAPVGRRASARPRPAAAKRKQDAHKVSKY